MTKKVVKAMINWLSPEQGGKKNIISQFRDNKDNPIIRYNPNIFFDGVDFGEVTWSADIYIKDLNEDLESNISLSFLVEWAPFELLKSGQSFKLYEGAKLVATGTIV